MIKTKRGPKVQESDHNPIIAKFNLSLKEDTDQDRIDIFDFKNKDSQQRFKEYTTNTKMLSSVFNSDEDIDILTNRFMKKLKGCIAMSFRKIRINNKTKSSEAEKLHERMTKLKMTKDDESKQEEMNEIVKELAKLSEENYNKVKDEIEKAKSNKGGMNSKQIWKMKKRSCPKSKDPPTAMLDSKGNLLMSNKAIENRAIEVFKERLSGNKIEPNLINLEKDTNKLCETRLKMTKLNKIKPWDMEDLKEVPKKLGQEKS